MKKTKIGSKLSFENRLLDQTKAVNKVLYTETNVNNFTLGKNCWMERLCSIHKSESSRHSTKIDLNSLCLLRSPVNGIPEETSCRREVESKSVTSATGPSEWDNRSYDGGEGRGTAGVKVIVVSGATHLPTVGESAVFTQPRPHECGPDPDTSAGRTRTGAQTHLDKTQPLSRRTT